MKMKLIVRPGVLHRYGFSAQSPLRFSTLRYVFGMPLIRLRMYLCVITSFATFFSRGIASITVRTFAFSRSRFRKALCKRLCGDSMTRCRSGLLAGSSATWSGSKSRSGAAEVWALQPSQLKRSWWPKAASSLE